MGMFLLGFGCGLVVAVLVAWFFISGIQRGIMRGLGW
jgi:hypothetical protein